MNTLLQDYSSENIKYPNMLVCNFFNNKVPGGIQNMIINEIISIHECRYELISSSYGNGTHFVARFLWKDELYLYDGDDNDGKPSKLRVRSASRFPPKNNAGSVNTLLYKKLN